MENRWIAIRASAGLAIAGSVCTLVLAGLVVAGAFLVAQRPGTDTPPIPLRVLSIAVALFMASLAAWGTVTAIGVFRRRAWARVSMVVFAGLLTVMCGSGILTILFIPIPASAASSPDLMR